MEGQKYCVYNKTRESFLSLGVTIADVSASQLRGLIEKLAVKGDSGIWITPYKVIPPIPGLAPIDLVYLDDEYRVTQEVESFPTSTVESLRDEAASALALPAHTIYSSQTQPGDQLVICVASEMERRLERLSGTLVPSRSPSFVVSSNEKQSKNVNVALDSSSTLSAKEKTLFHGLDSMDDSEPKSGRPHSLRAWLQNWLSSDRRRAPRHALPGVVAYYWTGSAPRAYQVADISASGFYLLTEERWFPGTVVLMTLQRTDSAGKNTDDYIAVQSRVVRWGSDGLGLAFVLSKDLGNGHRARGADRKTLERFLSRLKSNAAEVRGA